MTRVVIAAGGTAGHVVPAIAVADALRAEGADGHASSARASGPRPSWSPRPATRSTSSRQRPRPPQPAEGRRGRGPGRRGVGARAARPARARAPTSCWAAAATSPARPASPRSRMGLPLVLTEADSHLGLANRLLARRARRVCLAFPIAGPRGRSLPGHRPPRARARCSRPTAARRARALRDPAGRPLPAGLRRQPRRPHDQRGGARRVRAARRRGRRRAPWVLHVAGQPRLRRRCESAGSAAGRPERYTLLEYEPHLGDVLAAADLVLARAGGSVFEIAAAGPARDPGPLSRTRPPTIRRQRRAGWRTAARRS